MEFYGVMHHKGYALYLLKFFLVPKEILKEK
jgi:hypothetical protein